MYVYRAELDRVVDGDTVDFVVDLGFGVYHKVRVRMAGYDAPERFTDQGKRATSFLDNLLSAPETYIRVETEKDKKGKYGRYIASVFINCDDGICCVNDLMVDHGFVK